MSEVSDADGKFPEDDEAFNEDDAGGIPAPAGEPAHKGRRERNTSTKVKTKEIVESNEALFLRLLAEGRDNDQKLDAKTGAKLLKLYQEAQMGESRRAVDFMTSQRNYMYFLEKHNQSLAAQQTATQEAVLANINKIGELTKQANESQSGGKMKEAMEVFGMVMSLPIFTMLQEDLVDWMQERREKKREEKERAEAKANGKAYVAPVILRPTDPTDDEPQE